MGGCHGKANRGFSGAREPILRLPAHSAKTPLPAVKQVAAFDLDVSLLRVTNR
jgi:hypothetical protein